MTSVGAAVGFVGYTKGCCTEGMSEVVWGQWPYNLGNYALIFKANHGLVEVSLIQQWKVMLREERELAHTLTGKLPHVRYDQRLKACVSTYVY